MLEEPTFTAFAGHRLIASGDLATLLRRTKEYLDTPEGGSGVLIFEDQTGKEVDFDFTGTADEVVARAIPEPAPAPAEPAQPPRKGPGRPALGVVGGEISLLPRHWEWLGRQPGGISVTVRRLVDEERKRSAGREEARAALDAAGKFMWAMGGNLPGFEEASRALYARDAARLESLIEEWPADVRAHVQRLANKALRLDDGSCCPKKAVDKA